MATPIGRLYVLKDEEGGEVCRHDGERELEACRGGEK